MYVPRIAFGGVGLLKTFQSSGGGGGPQPIQVADVRIKGSPQILGKDVIDVAKGIADAIAKKSGSKKAERVARTIDAIDRGRNPTVFETDKLDLQVTIEGNLNPSKPSESGFGIKIKIPF